MPRDVSGGAPARVDPSLGWLVKWAAPVPAKSGGGLMTEFLAESWLPMKNEKRDEYLIYTIQLITQSFPALSLATFVIIKRVCVFPSDT